MTVLLFPVMKIMFERCPMPPQPTGRLARTER
ncbi:hypothetical protein J3R03_006678 [Actinoplanes couchii]|nr:hypothetical protein [Actinoplanes couchii]